MEDKYRNKGNEQKTGANVIDINCIDNQLKVPIIQTEIVRVYQKTRPSIFCLQETYFKYKNRYRLKVKESRKTYHANTSQKNAGVTTLTSQ